MMNLDNLVKIWKQHSLQYGCYTLTSQFVTDYEHHRHTNHGHYAFVGFTFTPADDLSFEIAKDAWPPSITAGARPGFESAIICGIVDVLVGSLNRYRGCHVLLTKIGYHEIDSNHLAFYTATSACMKRVIQYWHLGLKNI